MNTITNMRCLVLLFIFLAIPTCYFDEAIARRLFFVWKKDVRHPNSLSIPSSPGKCVGVPGITGNRASHHCTEGQ